MGSRFSCIFITASIEMQRFVDGEKQKESMLKHEEDLKRKTELELETKPPAPTINKTGVMGEHFNAKLPKLQIAPFEGVLTDWNRFWNTFIEEVDKKMTIPQITKFSYLKEYLGPQVRPNIESLPFTTEGYARAKTIMTTKYGKPS